MRAAKRELSLLSATEVIMKTKNTLAMSSWLGSALLFGGVLGLLAGCGDADVFEINAGRIDQDSIPTDHTCFGGSAIKLVRYSSVCGQTSSSLVSEVHEGMVFSAEDVRTLGSPCAHGPTPGIEIYFDEDSHSIFLDFSQVTHGDRFPEADFEGYVFEVTLEEANGILLGVTVDRELSSIGLNDDHVEWDGSHIDVNFEGVSYDHQGLLKLDLWFARASPLPG
jgi:hypothetical protein